MSPFISTPEPKRVRVCVLWPNFHFLPHPSLTSAAAVKELRVSELKAFVGPSVSLLRQCCIALHFFQFLALVGILTCRYFKGAGLCAFEDLQKL